MRALELGLADLILVLVTVALGLLATPGAVDGQSIMPRPLESITRASVPSPDRHVVARIDGDQSTRVIDLDAYHDALQQTLADLSRGDTRDIERAIARLESLEPVALPNGAILQTDNSAVLEDLRADPPRHEPAVARLRATLNELDSLGPPTATWQSDPEGSLTRVLERQEFGNTSPNPWQQLRANLREQFYIWLYTLLNKIFSGSSGSESPPLWSVVARLAGLALVVGLLLWVRRQLRRTFGTDIATQPVERTTVMLTAEDARHEAERLAALGDFRAAIRALYIAALLRWEEQGKLEFDRTLTNQEVLAKARRSGDPKLVVLLEPLVERFDRFWYGGIAPTSDDYMSFVRLATRPWETAES